jgi:hypothetical protein
MTKNRAWDNFMKQRKEQLLDIGEIEQWLKIDLGYEVVNLKQEWRHITGRIEKDNKKYFFKMASQAEISQKTRNEVEFNDQISKITKKEKVNYFTVPEILFSGLYKDLFYFVSEYFETNVLLNKSGNDKVPRYDLLERNLDKIVHINLWLISCHTLRFTAENNISIEQKWQESIVAKNDRFYQETSSHNLQEIKKVVDEYDGIGEAWGLCHRDFVPWHMIENDGQIVLIDAEHAGNLNPMFYDTAYFFTRLYTYGKNPKLAKLFLKKIIRNLSIIGKDEKFFWKHFKPILATRVIGAFWDAQNDRINIKIFEELRDDLLKDKIV